MEKIMTIDQVEEYAKKTIFKTRVAHCMLQGSILSEILARHFPGVGTIYLSQTLKFLKPVFIGDEITFRLTVLKVIKEKNRVRMESFCFNQKGEPVLNLVMSIQK